jgi:hypothetical protein
MPRLPHNQRSPFEKENEKGDTRRALTATAILPHQRFGDRAGGDADDDVLLRSAAVRRRYGGASDMWLSRRLRDGSGFPLPLIISRTRYWRKSDLLAWEAGLTRDKPAAERKPVRAKVEMRPRDGRTCVRR